jgi:serine/threonine-protein kinase
LLPLALFHDIKNWPAVIGFYGTLLVGALAAMRSARTGRPSVPVVLGVNLLIAVLFTRLAGPFVLTPLMACAALAAAVSIPWINARTWVVVGWALIAVLAPVLAEWLELLPRTWKIGDGRMTVISDIVQSHGRTTELSLIFANTLFTVVIALFILSITRRRRLAQQQLFVQAWHLRQLLPSSAPEEHGR